MIFGIGLSKTGNTSLRQAVRLFGLTTSQYIDPSQYKSLLDKKLKTDFVNDLPIAPGFKELAQIYPDAKFIYTSRAESSWLQSIETHYRIMEENANTNWAHYHQECYGALPFDRMAALDVYRQHKLEIEFYFRGREHQLLTMNICAGDGWDKLCPFLNKARPGPVFPHKNRTHT